MRCLDGCTCSHSFAWTSCNLQGAHVRLFAPPQPLVSPSYKIEDFKQPCQYLLGALRLCKNQHTCPKFHKVKPSCALHNLAFKIPPTHFTPPSTDQQPLPTEGALYLWSPSSESHQGIQRRQHTSFTTARSFFCLFLCVVQALCLLRQTATRAMW